MKDQLTDETFFFFWNRNINQVTTKCMRTDFAAPSGTPIMASGSGTITRQDGAVVVVTA